MRPSRYLKSVLFVSFSTSSRAAPWPTYSSMSREAALKSVKKTIKNHRFKIAR